MTKIIGAQPTPEKMTVEDGERAFHMALQQMTFHLGNMSKGIQAVQQKVDFNDQQLMISKVQAGSGILNGFVKTAIGNFMRTLRKDNSSIMELFVVGFLIYTEGLGQAMLAGFEPPEGFWHEQRMIFEGALDGWKKSIEKQKELQGEASRILTPETGPRA